MKRIIFSKILLTAFVLIILPMPLYSSWKNWVPEGVSQGFQSFYDYMPSVSEYLPSSPSWVTSLMNILSEHQKLLLFTTLAGVLGYKIYPYYT